MTPEPAIVISAAEVVCALGGSLQTSLDTWRAGRTALTFHEGLLAGRIADRTVLAGRRYGAASNLAVQVARRAVERAGWTEDQTREAWLFAASSRGNAGEMHGAHDWRRPSKRFRASNTMHSEIAAAVSIELGIRGPWQMLSNGCSSGLDALGLAWMSVRSGLTPRALVVAVDLPLVPELLRDFRGTRLLSTTGINDPLSSATDGFHPGEAGAAVVLESTAMVAGRLAEVTAYAANSDAYDSLMAPADGAAVADLLRKFETPALICPHATGTANHARSETAALKTAFVPVPPLLLLKPFTGHTLGASGLVDVALLAAAMHQGQVPPNLPDLFQPEGLTLTRAPLQVGFHETVLKVASGMGGHNAAVMLRRTFP